MAVSKIKTDSWVEVIFENNEGTLPEGFREILCVLHQNGYNNRFVDSLIIPAVKWHNDPINDSDAGGIALLWMGKDIGARISKVGNYKIKRTVISGSLAKVYVR